MARAPLDEEALKSALATLPAWRVEDDALRRTFRFSNFREAMSFLVRISFEAEQRDHHPEIFNVYDRVELTLRTHDAGNRITKADVELARAIDALSWV